MRSVGTGDADLLLKQCRPCQQTLLQGSSLLSIGFTEVPVGGVQASYPAIGAARKSMLEALTEVHLRRLDTEDMLHRCGVPPKAQRAALRHVSHTPVGARGSCGKFAVLCSASHCVQAAAPQGQA